MKVENIGAFPAPKGIHVAVSVKLDDERGYRYGVCYIKYDEWTYEQRTDLVEWLLTVDDRTPEDLDAPMF